MEVKPSLVASRMSFAVTSFCQSTNALALGFATATGAAPIYPPPPLRWRTKADGPAVCVCGEKPAARAAGRSEEHTSELYSLMRLSYAVFCLKKKKIIRHNDATRMH